MPVVGRVMQGLYLNIRRLRAANKLDKYTRERWAQRAIPVPYTTYSTRQFDSIGNIQTRDV